MRCPYCVSEIDDAALVCPRCTRELYLFKPLLERIGQLEKAVADSTKVAASNAETRIAALEQELTELKAAQANTVSVEVVAAKQVSEAKSGYLGAVVQALLPALILLITAHGFLLFVYDMKPLYLRIATILIPVPFGYWLALRYPDRLSGSLVAGLPLAIAGVLGMLTVTALIDKVPLMPQELREWRETVEYVLSIAFAFATGLLLGKYRAHRNLEVAQKNRYALLLARAFVPNEEGKLGIEKVAKQLNKLSEAVTPAATGAAAIYAGVKAFLGDLG